MPARSYSFCRSCRAKIGSESQHQKRALTDVNKVQLLPAADFCKMQKIEFGNKIAVFLDHRQLINQQYNEHLPTAAKTYELKAALFHFAEKKPYKSSGNVDGASAVPAPATSARKRKRNVLKTEEQVTGASTLLTTLQALSNDLLPRLKHIGAFAEHNACEAACAHFSRYWEERCDFPQFNGANATSEFQSFAFGQRRYLIPPQCRFFNCDVAQLTQLLPQLSQPFDLVTLDPPWRNKYIRRLKRARHELAYQMLDTEQLRKMPIARLVHERSLVAIWCTNSVQHQQALLNELLPAWHLRLLHELRWLKLNIAGELIGPLSAADSGHKQPYEKLYLACHRECPADFCTPLRQVHVLASVPSIVHSHKPPLLPWLRRTCPLPARPKCLELFARYLQPEFTAVGLEVLKLMDERLYATSGS